jgi:virginiamycin B lyase
VGPDGNLWFTECSGNRIGRITPTGLIDEQTLPSASSGPYWITAGPKHSLWFTEYLGNRIGHLKIAH